MLDRKLWRDLARLWAQALAVALVMACGVATMVIALGAYRSLEDTRSAFYERYRFATLFAHATRAPTWLEPRLRALAGISAVELRISKPILLDVTGMREPASGQVVSIPDIGKPTVNRLYLRRGRLPEAGRADEAAVTESFAKAHGFVPGDRFGAILNGRKRDLIITGIVLAPESIYMIGPGDMVPDDRRFAFVFMPRDALEGLFEMDGAFNELVATTLRGASMPALRDAIDDILAPYGGAGSFERDEHTSDAFLQAELDQLAAMARVIPPIFLVVSAFLVNMILTRLVALEREQIGLLKALGYGNLAVAMHYAKLVLLIAIVGAIVGSIAGHYLGLGLTRIFSRYFSFPLMVASPAYDLHLLGAGATALAGLAGAARALVGVAKLPPAVAMRPPAPPAYRSRLTGTRAGAAIRRLGLFSQLSVMAWRNMLRRPGRAMGTTFGIALSVALLISSLFTPASVDEMIETSFFRAARQDATLLLAQDTSPKVLGSLAALPGIMRIEPVRFADATLRNANRSQRLTITGEPTLQGERMTAHQTALGRVLDAELIPMDLPPRGLTLSEHLAGKLDLRIGDLVEAELHGAGGGRREWLTVAAIAQGYVGLSAYMNLDALDALVGDGRRVSAARLSIDPTHLDALYREVKETPAIAAVALQGLSREKLRETVDQNIGTQMTVYITLAIVITFGVVYNAARIQLSERARELASLRLFGFTKREVSGVLMLELAAQTLAAQPLGWAIGATLAWAVTQGFASDLYRIPLVLPPATFAKASLIVLAAALISASVVKRRVDRLDLIKVLKTRE